MVRTIPPLCLMVNAYHRVSNKLSTKEVLDWKLLCRDFCVNINFQGFLEGRRIHIENGIVGPCVIAGYFVRTFPMVQLSSYHPQFRANGFYWILTSVFAFVSYSAFCHLMVI